MAYNPYSATNAIYRLKGQWNKANEANDAEGKNAAAEKAQAYYEQLKKNGYSDLADELASSGEAAAKSINDKWAKTGKTATRGYLYSLGKSRGMSNSDIDGLIGWDNQSGEVSFGGKKVGKPDAVVDGTSYFGDTGKLDSAFNDYIERSGNVRPKPTAVNQENENLFRRYKQEYDDLKGTNPFTTEEAKAILSKYDLAGLQGRDNALASNAGSNGGNIDSFAAANALRQQASLVSQGQQAVLSAYQQKLDHARSLLSDMGVNIDRVYNQDETTKNNEVARNSEIASVTGYTPDDWAFKNDAFLKNFVGDDGKLKPEYESTDFQELINNAKAKGDTALVNKYAILRAKKIFDNVSKYGQYLNQGDISYLRPQKTEAARQFDEQIAQADRALKSESDLKGAELEAQKQMNTDNNQNALDQIKTAAEYNDKPALTAKQAATAIANGEKSQAVIDAYNYWYGTNYTAENPPAAGQSSNGGTTDDWSGGTSEQDEQMTKVIENLNGTHDSKETSKTVKSYIRNVLKPLIEGDGEIAPDDIKLNMLENAQAYDLEVDDIKQLCNDLGIDSSWVDGYKNKGIFGWGAGVKPTMTEEQAKTAIKTAQSKGDRIPWEAIYAYNYHNKTNYTVEEPPKIID